MTNRGTILWTSNQKLLQCDYYNTIKKINIADNNCTGAIIAVRNTCEIMYEAKGQLL